MQVRSDLIEQPIEIITFFIEGVKARGTDIGQGVYAYGQEYRQNGAVGRWWPRGVALTNLPKSVLPYALAGIYILV